MKTHAGSPATALRLGGDLHEHLTMHFSIPLFAGLPGDDMTVNARNRLGNQLSAPALRRAGVRVIVASIWPPPGRDEMTEVQRQLTLLQRFADSHPDFAICHTAAEARRALEADRLALIPGVEGAGSVQSVADVDRLYIAGVRVVTLVHFFDSALADARDDQLGPLGLVTNGRDFGLTPLGRDVVTRMSQLGIVVDLDHASSRTVDDALDVLEPLGVPAIASHVGAAMHTAHTLNDSQAMRLAKLGGLIGIGIYRDDLLEALPPQERFEGFQPGTCDELVAQWVHYVSVAGADHVMLGSDLNSVIDRAQPGGYCPDGMRNASDLPWLFAGLVSQGIPRESLDNSGERLLSFLERIETLATAKAAAPKSLRTGPFDTAL